MHICYWYHRPYPSNRSTAIDEYIRLVSDKPNYDVTVIAASEKEESSVTWENGVRVINIPSDVSTARSVSPSIFGLRGVKHLRRLNRKHPIDILQFHAFPGLGFLLAPGIALPNNITTIADVRGTAVSSERAEFLSRVGIRGQRVLVDAMITVDDLVAGHIFGGRPDDVHIVPLGADLERFKDVNSKSSILDTDPDEIIVGYVGGLHPSRNLHQMIEGIGQLDVEPTVHLYIVGDGKDRNRLEKQADIHDVPTTFTGSIPHSEVPEHLAAMNIGLSYIPDKPQYTNQPPIKTIEYLASGLPTVATLTRWHQKHLTDGENAVLVPDTAQGIRDGISRILSSSDVHSKLVSQSRESIMGFDYNRIVENKLLHLYRDVS